MVGMVYDAPAPDETYDRGGNIAERGGGSEY